MKSTFSAKAIGIIISVLVVGAVGTITFVSEKKTPAPLADNTIPSTSSSTTQTSVTTSQKSAGNYSGDDEGGNDENSSRTPVTSVTPPPPATTSKNYVTLYKNGTYSANGTYYSPGGQDEIAVTVTLANDIITDATVTSVSADHTSLRYQNKFISGYKQYVIGQNIKNLNLTVVSGSSLTPEGFNSALAKIKAQSKA